MTGQGARSAAGDAGAAAVPALLAAALDRRPEATRWVAAFSGGPDSTTLLHAARALARARGAELLAAHVNHGLQPAAAEFEAHCRAVCAQWGVAFAALRRPARPAPGESPEAAARTVRYRALREFARPGSAVLLAHHRRDQAETLLLQLLRGAGPAGLAAMPAARPWGGGWLLRPLLDCPAAEIAAYLRRHGLAACADPDNRNLRRDRNFLRRTLLPEIERRWPAAERTLARAARHQAQARTLLAERAREDGADAEALPLARLAGLSAARRENLVRFWLLGRGAPAPGERQLRAWLRAVAEAAPDRLPRLRCGEFELHRWRGRLHLAAATPPLPADRRWRWPAGRALALPELGLTLAWEDLRTQLGGRVGTELEVRLRRGGERCRRPGRRCRPLKKWLQDAGVPPWRRSRIPLVYENAELRLVWGHFPCVPQPPGPGLSWS